MIRQLGLPTFFITLSAAETRWGELLKSLKKIADNIDISIEEAENLPFIEKAKLIRNDPVTCARYFDHIIRLMLNLIKNKNGIFPGNHCIDYYFKIEVQQRGSLHLHGLFWLEKAPVFNERDPKSILAVIEFIDKYCSTDSDSLSIEYLKDMQTHNHTRTCKREICGEIMCRFKMPKPPMKETMILFPLDDKIPKNQIIYHENHFEKIMRVLNNLYKNRSDSIMEYSFDEFLSEIELSYCDYILALRSSLKTETIFLKRKVKDILTNVFNKDIIELHKANMDIQFILNPYSLCNYLVNYI